MKLAIILKLSMKRVLRKLGWEMRRFSDSDSVRLTTLLNERKIETVFDVGANIGQFSKSLFDAGYSGKVISFEPLLEAYNSLVENSKSNNLWTVAPRCAVGAINSTIQINVSKNSVSSSVLGILDTHTSIVSNSRYIGKETVSVVTLDFYSATLINNKTFLKIDVQGYEMHVLEGAKDFCKKISGIQLEVSIVKLYEGQPDFLQLIKYIQDMGFNLWDVIPGFKDNKTGKLLQFDAIFFRE